MFLLAVKCIGKIVHIAPFLYIGKGVYTRLRNLHENFRQVKFSQPLTQLWCHDTRPCRHLQSFKRVTHYKLLDFKNYNFFIRDSVTIAVFKGYFCFPGMRTLRLRSLIMLHDDDTSSRCQGRCKSHRVHQCRLIPYFVLFAIDFKLHK